MGTLQTKHCLLRKDLMFNFFKKKSPPPVNQALEESPSKPLDRSQRTVSTQDGGVSPEHAGLDTSTPRHSEMDSNPDTPSSEGTLGWRARLAMGLKKTGLQLRQVFTGQVIDDALFEHLEEALLLSDAGPQATAHLLKTLEALLKKNPATHSDEVRHQLASVLEELLRPLEAQLDVSRHHPFVMMLTGVNGAGKTTSIGNSPITCKVLGPKSCWPRATPFEQRPRSNCWPGPIGTWFN